MKILDIAVVAIVCALVAVQGWATDPVWVKVAADNSSAAAKAAADFVCPGTNDQETIQAAIDLCAKDGRNLFLYNGVYMIDAFREWKDGGPRAAVRIPNMRRRFTIEGQEFFQTGRGTIPDDWKVWKNGVIWYARPSIWPTAGDGVPSVLRGEWSKVSSQNGSGLRLQNVSVFICDAQHPARCVDLRWTDAVEVRNMRLYGIGYRMMNGDVHPFKKFGPLQMPHIDAIGITMTSGSNVPVSRFDNIAAIGFGQGFQVGGEHVICNDCLALRGLYGWTFGNYKYSSGYHIHPIVLINCADEQNVNMPLFANVSHCDQRHQSVTMVGCNFERMEPLMIGGRLGDFMRETVPGSWRGRIEYTLMPEESNGRNAEEFPLWAADGSGSGFETRNLAHKRMGPSAERRKYSPHLGQQYFDTDLGKALVCTDPATRKWVDAMGVPVDDSTVSPERMKAIYEEVKTPHKVGMALEPEEGEMFDNPMVFRHGRAWYMMYIRFDGKGYETHLAKSDDLKKWTRLGRIFSRGAKGAWDASQADGWPALVDTRWKGPNRLNTFGGKYWMMYLGGAADGYETDPLSTGVAWTDDPAAVREWTRYEGNPVMGPSDPDARDFEKKTIYKHFTVDDPFRSCGGRFVNFYNAKQEGVWREAIGMAVSDDLLHWRRVGDGPVIDNGDADKSGISGDPMIRRIGDTWVMFYFGYKWKDGVKGAFDTFACSYDLKHWTKWAGEPLVKPSEGYDCVHAHKPWVLKHEGVVYHWYCAVGKVGGRDVRGIALATSAD